MESPPARAENPVPAADRVTRQLDDIGRHYNR